MTFTSKLGHFIIFLFLTVVTVGLYPIWWTITMAKERNELLREIRDSAAARR